MNIGREANWTVDPYGPEDLIARAMDDTKHGPGLSFVLTVDQARDLRLKLTTALASADHAERGRVLARRDAANSPW